MLLPLENLKNGGDWHAAILVSVTRLAHAAFHRGWSGTWSRCSWPVRSRVFCRAANRRSRSGAATPDRFGSAVFLTGYRMF